MKTEKKYEFQQRLLQIHETGVRNRNRLPQENEFQLPETVVIKILDTAGEVLKVAAEDFADYLNLSMGLTASVVTEGEASVTVMLAEDAGVDLGEFKEYRGFRIETTECGIFVYGHDDRGVAQALYYLEDLMTFAKAPVLTKGIVNKKPAFSPQMIHSGYNLDDYPDEYLARVAHEGRDAILLFVKGANETTFGHLDFNDLIARAARYGIDVYAYSYMHSEMSPVAPEAEAYYDGLYGELFRQCPGLKGVILVGESVGFPSSDPVIVEAEAHVNEYTGVPSVQPASGWYPCCDYPVWLNMVANSIRNVRPDADIVFWTYNWGYHPEELRVKLIESLPTDITLMATFEMFQMIDIGKAKSFCADYTLTIPGPGTYFTSEAIAAKKRGIRLYSMTNTGGMTWDFGMIPYQPMPHQWMRRYEAMHKAKADWGLCGIMENHHYGFYRSFISKLSKHCFFEPRDDMDEILKSVLISEYGEENYEKVLHATKCFSEANRYYTPGNADQYGAFRVGPSYPFCLSDAIPMPSKDNAQDPVTRYIFPRYYTHSEPNFSPHQTPLGIRIHEEIRSIETMLSYMEEGFSSLCETKNRNEKLEELVNFGHFLRNYVVTGLNAKKWHVLTCRMHSASTAEDLKQIYDEMELLLEAEIANAQDTIPVVERDSRLGFEPRMKYLTDRWHLEWKIAQVRYVIDTDLAEFRTCLDL